MGRYRVIYANALDAHTERYRAICAIHGGQMFTYMLVLMLNVGHGEQRFVMDMDYTAAQCAAALDVNRKVAETGKLFCERQK